MKKIASLLLSLGLLLFITSCGNPGSTSAGSVNQGGASGSGGTGDDPLSGISITIPEVTLPDSVGENPFAGKSFTLQDNSEESDTATVTWSFTDSIATCSRVFELEHSEKTTYQYTYNTNSNMLYLSGKSLELSISYSNMHLSISSASDLSRYIKDTYGNINSQERKELLTRWLTTQIFHKAVYQYAVSGDSIYLTTYFNGSTSEFIEWENDVFYLKGNMLFLRTDPYTLRNCPFSSLINFSEDDGTFSGKLIYYEFDENEDTGSLDSDLLKGDILGEISGTYTVNGTGASDCSITLTFTNFPVSIPGYSVEIPYILTQID